MLLLSMLSYVECDSRYVCELLVHDADKSSHNRVGFARVTSAALCLVLAW
jgi:hypothetical protein